MGSNYIMKRLKFDHISQEQSSNTAQFYLQKKKKQRQSQINKNHQYQKMSIDHQNEQQSIKKYIQPSEQIQNIKQEQQIIVESTQSITHKNILLSHKPLQKQLDQQNNEIKQQFINSNEQKVKKQSVIKFLNQINQKSQEIRIFNQSHDKKIQKQNDYVKINKDIKIQKKQSFQNKLNLSQFQFSKSQGNFEKQFLQNKHIKKNQSFQSKQLFIIDKKLTQQQKQINILDQKVYFPYQPYQLQKTYMQKVIQALNNKKNALLQSPTGTGKTLCLLSAVLSWAQNHYRQTNKKIKIIFSSRTHSQLKQIQKELKKTCFRPNMAIFASRQQLCIKAQLSQLKGKQKIESCSKAIKLARKMKNKLYAQQNNENINIKQMQAACQYHKQKEYVMQVYKSQLKNKLLEVDTMRKYGEQFEFCPYFYPLNVKSMATLFLMPYNYILDVYLLPNYEQIITDSIIIFDEAHNVAQSACEGRSIHFDTLNLQGAIDQLDKILKGRGSTQLKQINQNNHNQLNTIYKKLSDYNQTLRQYFRQNFPQNSTPFNNFQQNQSKVISKDKIYITVYQLFTGTILTDQERKRLQTDRRYLLNKINTELLRSFQEICSIGMTIIQFLKQTSDGYFSNLQKVLIFLQKLKQLLLPVFRQENLQKIFDFQINHFRLHFSKSNNNKHYTIGLKCLIPQLTFQTIKKFAPYSIIMTSGTLKPLQMWQKQLKIDFKVQLSNSHVIKKDQISCNVIEAGPNDVNFTFTFENLKNNSYKIYKDLIQSLISICSNVPNGVMLVFPSFKVLGNFKQQFLKSNKRSLLQQIKHIIFQQRSTDLSITQFKKKATSKKGALLIIVCRGKFSEGIDFPNQLCRAVILIGIPFANLKDPFINQKKNHLQWIASRSVRKSQCIRGEDWYFMGTMRAINQALGRVIRHSKDYGMIFLVDSRYKQKKFQRGLPEWIVQSKHTESLFGKKLQEYIQFFFDQAKSNYPIQKKQQYEIEIEVQKKQQTKRQKVNGIAEIMKKKVSLKKPLKKPKN